MKRSANMLGLLCFLGLFLGGCASMQPLSNYARSGDTVAISLGGTDTNALVPVLQKDNVSVAITDSAGSIYPVKLRNLFRLYSDPTSRFDFRNLTGSNGYVEYYPQAHQGIWMAVLDLVDPGTGTPLPLAAGAASISVSSPDIQNWVDPTGYGWTWTNGNLDAIPIEVLAGQGSPSPLNYLEPMTHYPLDSLEPFPQLEVSVSGTPSATIGGGSFTFQYNADDFTAAAGPRATLTTPDRNVQLSWNHIPQGDGTVHIKVHVTNPHGFSVNNNREQISYLYGQGGKSLLRSLRFNLVWDTEALITDDNWQNHIQLVNAQYLDIDGNAMPEITPLVRKVN